MELAKCEEDIEQIQVAMEHLKKVGERMRVWFALVCFVCELYTWRHYSVSNFRAMTI